MMREQTMIKVAQVSGWCCQKQQILLTQQTKNGAIKKDKYIWSLCQKTRRIHIDACIDAS